MQKKEIIFGVLISVIIIGVVSYKSWQKSERIADLENTIKIQIFSSPEELKSSYIREKIEKSRLFNSLNDSILILYSVDNISEDNGVPYLNLNVKAINKTKRDIQLLNGYISVKDSSKILMNFPAELSPKFLPNTDTTIWI